MTKLAGMTAIALLASLGACGSAEQPAQNNASAARMTMDGPFAESEMEMDTAIKAAVGADAADTWLKKMIAHHDGAIAMSRVVLGLEPTPDVAKMAQKTIDDQGAEIEALKALVRSAAADADSAKLYDAATAAMHSKMMAAAGATPSETYLAKMLAHHSGAVAMSDVALANGATGAVRAQIQKMRAAQLQEAEVVEAMLRGEPITMQMPATSDTVTPVPRPKAASPNAATTKPGPAKAAASNSLPEPEESPEPSPTCAPEHREAGHC